MSRRLLIITTVSSTLKAFLLPYARHFRAMGWTVDAAAADASGNEAVIEAFDSVFDIPWSRRIQFAGSAGAARKVREVVDAGAYDAVHVHTPVAAAVTRFALKASRVPVIYTAHGLHFYEGQAIAPWFAYSRIERQAACWTSHMVVINEEDRRAARRVCKLPQDKVTFMPGIGLDTSSYDRSAVNANDIRAFRSELGIGADDTVITCVAELIPRKRPVEVIEAFAGVHDKSAHLVFAGHGPLLDACREMAAQRGLSERVHFAGFVDAMPVLLAASDATVLFSSQEGLPRSSMESQAMGVPVIGSDIRGLRDLLAGGGGVIVPSGDIDALTAAMQRVCDDPVWVAGVGAEAACNVGPGSKYDLANLLKLHEELYERVLGGTSEYVGHAQTLV